MAAPAQPCDTGAVVTRHDPSLIATGDFQTPQALADRVCETLSSMGISPRSLIEPTCGTGAFLRAGLRAFGTVEKAVGIDIDASHLRKAREAAPRAMVELVHRSVFETDIAALVGTLPAPVLALGNPPWVTIATLGRLGKEGPARIRRASLRGIESITGKSNFDVSEWLVTRIVIAMQGVPGTAAFLLKTSVARRVLEQAWMAGIAFSSATMHGIDARAHFGASVDACLLTLAMAPGPGGGTCDLHDTLGSDRPRGTIGLVRRRIVKDPARFSRLAHLFSDHPGPWRSGIKHDCARVMELTFVDGTLVNGLGEQVDIEPGLTLPLLKGTDLARGRLVPTRRLIVTQRHPSDDTCELERKAPRAWRYLSSHASLLGARRSRIHANRPPFAIFGVGPYSFAPVKVAVSCLHASMAFALVPPHEGEPVVFDDTVAFAACESMAEARRIHGLVTSEPAREFLAGQMFEGKKRPVTVSLLDGLDLEALSRHLVR